MSLISSVDVSFTARNQGYRMLEIGVCSNLTCAQIWCAALLLNKAGYVFRVLFIHCRKKMIFGGKTITLLEWRACANFGMRR